MSKRMDPAERRAQILDSALKVAQTKGLKKTTRIAVAAAAGVSHGLVSMHFDGRDALLECIADHAVRKANFKIIAEAVDMGLDVKVPRTMSKAVKELRAPA